MHGKAAVLFFAKRVHFRVMPCNPHAFRSQPLLMHNPGPAADQELLLCLLPTAAVHSCGPPSIDGGPRTPPALGTCSQSQPPVCPITLPYLDLL